LNSLKSRHLTVALSLVFSLLAVGPHASSGQSATPSRIERSELMHRVKELQRRMMLSGGLAELREHREMARRAKLARRRSGAGAIHQKPVLIPELGLGRPSLEPSSGGARSGVNALGPHVLAHDTTRDRPNA